MSDNSSLLSFRVPVQALFFCLLLFPLSGGPVEAGQVALVPAGSTWRYLDNGSNQGTAWRSPAFDDSAWPSAPAEFGYGDGDEATLTAKNKITTYFRRSFEVAGIPNLSDLQVNLIRDDGAVVYLNGTEVFRSNMPTGTISSTTLAAASVSPPAESTFFTAAASTALLVEGTNVLAVEVHQSSASNSDLSFDLELSVLEGVSLTRGAYLQRAAPQGVVVRWRTNFASDSLVQYGPDPGDLSASAYNPAVTTEHEVEVSGLLPDARYYYSIGTSAETLAGGDAYHTFVTSPVAGTGKPTRIWALGDSGTANSAAAAVRNAYLAYTGTRATDVWLMLGDNAYPSGTDAQYTAAVFDMYPMFLRQTALWPTFGNHDASSADSSNQSGPYYSSFTLPKSGEAGGVPSGTEAYYSFNYGNIHFICLDSSESSRSLTGPMLTWLRNDLSANTLLWTIAFFHHPLYSKGAVDSDTSGIAKDLRKNALPSMEGAGIDLVLAGHNHNYERSYLIDAHYGSSTTFTESMKKDGGDGRVDGTGPYQKPFLGPSPHEGTVYVVAGSSGSVSNESAYHPAMYTVLASKGSLVIDIDGARLDAAFLTDTGAILDHFTILKGTSSTPPPAAPSDLTASAVTTTQVLLGWSDNSTGENGFKVERSTNGSTFFQIAQAAQNAIDYLDTTASPGTTYYYRVRAYNSALNSDYSNTAIAATPALPPPPDALVPAGSIWRYLDNGTNQGTAWRAAGFDDSSWASGQAELGYGDGDEATVVGYGPDASKRYITTYFRHTFSVAEGTSFAGLTVGLRRDDGGVVYLNGVEVFRSNMPTGTIGFTTLASSGASDEKSFYQGAVSPALLLIGDNIIAVEIHQASAGSSDISFDLKLTGTN